MGPPGNILLLFLLPAVTAQKATGSCSGCGPFSLPLLASFVVADAVVSLLILAIVFVCVRPRGRPTQEEGKVYINMPTRG